MAVTVPMADGAKVIYIPQPWLAEMVPTQEGPYKAKSPLLVPVIVVMVAVTQVVLVLLKKTATGWVGKFKGTVPNSIGLGKKQRERRPGRRFQLERGKRRRQ